MRATLRAGRLSKTIVQKSRDDAAIRRRLDTFLRAKDARTIAGYVPEEAEPGGKELLSELGDFELWLPVCRPGGILHWGRYEGPQSLTPGRYGILEPQPTATSLAEIAVDVVVVPAMGARFDGARIGRGAGFYDRALENLNALKVVLLYDQEVREDIPTEPHDVFMDVIITPNATMLTN